MRGILDVFFFLGGLCFWVLLGIASCQWLVARETLF